MARATQSRNLFGWLTKQKTTYQRSRGEASHVAQAYRAGVKSGDTGEFDLWLSRQRFTPDRSTRKRLEDNYRRGVERAGTAERVAFERKTRKDEKRAQKQTALSSYKGVRLYKLGGGEYTTSIDRDSRFDSLQDAKDFIGSWKSNPGCARTTKTNVTDRAKRYRANQPGCRPAGLKKCKLCGSRSDVMVDHVDGDESNGRKSNLRWLCRSCNTTLGPEMARSGQGRRTVQYNPGGARTLGEYMQAVLMHTRGAHDEGGRIIHETPKRKREEYASQIWSARKARGNPTLGYGVYTPTFMGEEQLAHFTSKGAAETWARSSGVKGYTVKRAFKKNPAASAAQYRLAQAVLAGTARSKMPKKVAQEIVDRTPAKLRSEFMERNPESTTEYSLAYNLGQRDRETASLRKSQGELCATFAANFAGSPTAQFDYFDTGYQAGYGGQIGAAAPNGQRTAKARFNPETEPAGDGSEEYEQARVTAELFHGRPVREEIEVEESIRTHDWYVSIGPLIKLKIRTLTKRKATLPFARSGEAMVHLFCSPDGRQFYLRGGDQELDLKPLGMGQETDWYRDHMLIGEAKEITYQDKKKFHNFKLIDYYHKLGEVTKEKPMLAYNALAGKLEIIGGQYKIETEDLVDDMSPGIVN